MKMARQLIEDMSGHWSAQEFRDEFHDAVMHLVEAKAKAGDSAHVEPLEEAPDAQDANVIDLTDLLRRSLRGGAGAQAKAEAGPAAERKAAPAKASAKKTGSASTRARKPAEERAAAAAPARKAAAKKAPAKASRARRAA